MERLSTGELLRLHRGAYQCLLALDRRSAVEPAWLGEDVVAELRRPGRCLAWLRAHRERLAGE